MPLVSDGAALKLIVLVPPLTVTVLVDVSAPARTRVPVADRIVPPAGRGAFDSVSGTLPLTPPAKVVVFATRTSGAFVWVTAPAKVSGPPAKATGVLLP